MHDGYFLHINVDTIFIEPSLARVSSIAKLALVCTI